jgi:hypothetical protein
MQYYIAVENEWTSYNTYILGNVTMKLLCSYVKQTKCLFFKNRGQGKTGPVWGIGTSGRGRYKERV